MFFYVNIFTSTEDGIAEKLLLFKIKFVVIFNLYEVVIVVEELDGIDIDGIDNLVVGNLKVVIDVG